MYTILHKFDNFVFIADISRLCRYYQAFFVLKCHKELYAKRRKEKETFFSD